ncbi:hypothetical protein [Halobacteriovorax sp. RT-2-6]|uniref:hypothetical protein n=1 Tax=unclassified Halobacteriovorax TaxID=2639665 RepID=UPI00399BF014
MTDEEYRKKLDRRIKVLKRNLEAGKVKIAPDLIEGVRKSLLKVKIADDGVVDVDSVDGRIRSMALAVTHFEGIQELKDKNPLSEIQKLYFEIFERNFGWLYKDMIKAKATPHIVATYFSDDDEKVKSMLPQVKDFAAAIFEFWENCVEPAYYHIQELNSAKVVFGGDMFPSHSQNIASSVGVYVDTIVLPDPFVRAGHIFAAGPHKQQVYFAIKHALNILQYKELADAEIDVPIILILPEDPGIYGDHNDFLKRLAQPDVLAHGSKIFGTSFTSINDMHDFIKKHNTIESFFKVLANPERLLFDLEWKGDKRHQIQRYLDDFIGSFGGVGFEDAMLGQIFSRMHQANDLLLKSKRLNGTPIIDAPTSWEYFQWKLEYNSPSDGLAGKQHIVTQKLVEQSGELQWFGNVPVDALIEMRKNGALYEIRDMLSKGLGDIRHLSQDVFASEGEKVAKNLTGMFKDYNSQIEALKQKKWKLGTQDFVEWLAKGAIVVGAATSVHPIFGLSGYVLEELFDIPKMKDLIENGKDILDESRKTKESPLGLMFRHVK